MSIFFEMLCDPSRKSLLIRSNASVLESELHKSSTVIRTTAFFSELSRSLPHGNSQVNINGSTSKDNASFAGCGRHWL